MSKLIQTNYLAQMNQLQAMQAQVKFWESSNNYRKAIDTFKQYIDLLKEMGNQKSIVNGYIRMAHYCEAMEDRLFASDLYNEALTLMLNWGIGLNKVPNLQNKIERLSWF